MGELPASVSFVSDKLDDTTNLLKEFKAELAAVTKKNAEFNQFNSMFYDLCMFKDKVRTLEKYSRKNNVEISAILVTQKENVTKLVMDVGTALGIDVKEQDISAAHRVPSYSSRQTPALIVQFISRAPGSIDIENRELTAHHVNSSFPKHKVYINEHLSLDNKVFLAKLKVKCKDVGYGFAWCRDGKFFLRKAEGDRFQPIDSYQDQLK